jgi:hypothetical protein
VVLRYVAIAHVFATTTTSHILETFQAVQEDLPTENWSSAGKVKEKKLKILKIRFYVGNRIL